MQLDDVREQLRDLAARVPDGSTSVEETFARTRRSATRRRVSRAVATLAIVVVIGTLAVVINASRPAPEPRVRVSSPTTVVPKPIPFTEEQLQAHDGVGAPRGWVPIDAGGARLWVPGGWRLSVGISCSLAQVPGEVMVSKLTQVNCHPLGGIKSGAAQITPSTTAHAGLYRTIHGYRVYRVALRYDDPIPDDAFYDVPQLGVSLRLQGTKASRVLDTLAPSSRRVALAFAEQPTPASYRTVAESGVSLLLPSNWAEETPVAVPCLWPSSYPNAPELLRIPPDISPSACMFSAPIAANATGDGILLYTSRAVAPAPGRRPLAVLEHRATTVTVYDSGNEEDSLDLFVHRAGSSTTHVVTIALGRDGRIAGGILASIQATK